MNDNYSTGSDLGQSSTADRLRETAAGLAGSAKQQVNSLFDDKKSMALSEVGQLADALRRVGAEMQGSGIAGNLINTAADKLQSVGSSLENRSLDDIKNDVERFARRNPAAFLGGAIVLGVLAARFLKSHGHPSQEIGFYPQASRSVADVETPFGTTPATSVGSDFGISSTSSGLGGSTGSSVSGSGISGSGLSGSGISGLDRNDDRGGIR